MLVWLFHYLCSFFLYLWTSRSINFAPESYQSLQQGVYTTEVVLIIFFTVFVCKIDPLGPKAEHGILIVATFLQLQASAVYQCSPKTNEAATFWKVIEESCLLDLCFMFLAFLVTYIFIRYIGIHRFKAVNYLAIAGVLVFIFGAKLTNHAVNGSNLYFMGLMVYAAVLALYPFAAAEFCSLSNNRFIGGIPTKLSYNSVLFLLYNFCIFGGCALNNEFGLLLLIALTSTILFFIRERDLVAKLFYSLVSGVGGITAIMVTSHLSSRFQIFLDPAGAYASDELRQQASSIMYIYKHFKTIGWYGEGVGHLSSLYFPTRLTDHVLVLLFENLSVLVVIGVLVAGAFLVRWLLTEAQGVNCCERYLNLACGLLVGFTMLFNVISCCLITIGIPFPFISKGISINTALMGLVAVHTALIGKEKGGYFDDDL